MAASESKSPLTPEPAQHSSDAKTTELRVLLTNEEASVIIGRKGANATRIRTETAVFLTILKTDAPSPERLMVLKGSSEALVAAVLLIAHLLTDQAAEKSAPSQGESKPFSFRVLVHKFLAGCIIGPSGTIVREIQTATGARLSLSVEPLPNSTDKVCSISGTPDAVAAATGRILTQLADNPLRPGCSVVPYVVNAFQNSPFYPSFPLGGFPFGQSSFGSNSAAATLPFANAGQFGRFPAPPSGSIVPPAFTRTEKMVIPSACAGSVIGRNGSIIKDIKTQSGTKISLAEASDSGDRIVTITGSVQGIQVAMFLIRQRVETQQQLQAQQAKKTQSTQPASSSSSESSEPEQTK